MNRLMLYECHPAVCRAGEQCFNQRFQRRQDADAAPCKTEGKGWGLLARSDIEKVNNICHTSLILNVSSTVVS